MINVDILFEVLVDIIVIVIVILEFLKRCLKAKRIRALAYPRVLHQIRGVVQSTIRARLRSGYHRPNCNFLKGVVQRIVHGNLRSNFQRVGGDTLHVKGLLMLIYVS